MTRPSLERLGEPASRTSLRLEDLIAPVTTERFFEQYWERRYLLVERNDPSFYDDLFKLEDVDRVLWAARACPERTLTLGPPRGSDRSRVRTAASDIRMSRVYGAFCEGYSMRLGGVHRFCPSLRGLQEALSERLSAGISVELYLTPASTQGVTAHYDNRDSFILQIHGSKRWHLGEPIFELPGLAVNHVTDRIPSQLIENDASHLADSVVVEAGDLLYLPRGFYHQPVAEDETSLHLSAAVYPLSWGDFLTRAVELMARRHPTLQRALPPGFAAGAGAPRDMAETFSELVEMVARGASFEETLGAVIRDPRTGAPGDLTS